MASSSPLSAFSCEVNVLSLQMASEHHPGLLCLAFHECTHTLENMKQACQDQVRVVVKAVPAEKTFRNLSLAHSASSLSLGPTLSQLTGQQLSAASSSTLTLEVGSYWQVPMVPTLSKPFLVIGRETVQQPPTG